MEMDRQERNKSYCVWSKCGRISSLYIKNAISDSDVEILEMKGTALNCG
jgi:hypothetical protein